MTSKYCTIYLTFVIFCTNFRHGLTDPSTRTEVKSKLTCTSQWQKLRLNWSSAFTYSPLQQNFSVFWRENEKEFKAQTVNRMLETVIYPHNFSKEFLCYGYVTCYKDSFATWTSNVSFNVTPTQIGSELLGVRFLSIRKYERRLEFYIRPRIDISQLSYNLSYCCWDYVCSFLPHACPKFRTVQFNCSLRENDVYGIPNSAGFICRAFTTDNINVYARIKFHIWSTTRNGSTSKSADFRIRTKSSVEGPISQHANQGHFTVVVMDQKPAYLVTFTTEQRVTLRWKDTASSSYRINYSCPNGIYASKSYKQTVVYIYNKHFPPYSLCKFCLESQTAGGSLWSEQRCNASRFPEQLPSKPPTITCDYKTCLMTNYPNETRAVTIQCKLPEKTTRNGVLNKLMIKYWNTNNTNALDHVFSGNLSSCEVTLEGLSKRQSYAAQIAACNTKGCSDFSDSVSIATAVNSDTENQSETKQNWLPLLGLLSVVVIVLGVLAVYVLYRKRKTKPDEGKSLPSFEEPKDYEELQTNIAHQPDEYDTLPNGEANDNSVDKIEKL